MSIAYPGRTVAGTERTRTMEREKYRRRRGGKVRVYTLRRPHLCTGCDQQGHNIRRCPRRDDA